MALYYIKEGLMCTEEEKLACMPGVQYKEEKLTNYLYDVDRYIKNHTIQRIGIVPLKEYRKL